MKILVLAGGSDQIALISELKNRGHHVILLDYLSNPPAKECVEKHIQESTLDTDKVKEWALTEKVDMIVTACTDQALLTVAKVSEELCLPCYISYKTAQAVTNKLYMKNMMMASGIPTSNYHILNSTKDMDKVRDLSLPVVVKPVDCNSSKWVIKVTDISELEKPLEAAINLSRTSHAIVEEYREGTEISADFYISNYCPILLSVTTSTKIKGKRGFTINGSKYPVLTEIQQEKITGIAKQIAISFGLKETPLLVQAILSDNEFFVIEFSARMGGGSKYRLIQAISGVDIMSKYVDLILGYTPEINPVYSNDFVRMIYIYCNNGIITEIKGLTDLIKKKVVTESFLYKSLGSTIDKAETSSDRVLGLLVEASSENAIKEKIKAINSSLSIIDSEGKDIMMHNLLEDYD